MKNTFKNLFKIFLTFIIIFTNINFTFAEDITPQPPEKEEPPKIRMGGDGSVTLEAGSETTTEIPIINTAQSYAYNLLIQAKPEKDAPFTIKFLDGTNRKNFIERVGSTKALLSFNIDKNAVPGTYPVTLEFSYTGKDKTSYNNSDTLYVKIENKNNIPNVILNNFKASKQQINMGEQFTLDATLESTNKIDAKNLSLQVLGLEESNMALIGNTDTVYFDEFLGNSKLPVQFKFATNQKTKEGSNKLTFKLVYTDIAGKEFTREFQYYVNVLKNGAVNNNISDIKITSLTPPSSTLGVNQSGTFTLKLKNFGKSEAKNIKITAKIPEGLVPTSSNIVVIPSIQANQEKTITFNVAPTSTAITQAYSVGFSVEISNGSNSNEEGAPVNPSFEQYAGVNVNNPNPKKPGAEGEKEKTSVPKIIISKYVATPTIPEAGKPFELAMTFKNTHSVKKVKNIKLYLTVEDKTEEKGNVFAPNNSSTTFYIPEIAPNSEVSHVFDLFTVPDAKPRSYTINVNFEYEDEQANEYKTTELVGVNVKQQSKLETSEINMPQSGNMGEPLNLSFQVYNTGKVILSNLKIKLEGENFDTSMASSFIGNLDSGGSEYFEGTFIPNKTGEQNIKLTISYDDTDGQTITKTDEYKINIQEPQQIEETFNDMPKEETKKPFIKNTLVKGGIIVLVIILVISFILYLRKKAKLKKEFDFNE